MTVRNLYRPIDADTEINIGKEKLLAICLFHIQSGKKKNRFA